MASPSVGPWLELTDLAHDLKNPVAAVRTCAEGLVTQFLERARAEAGLPNEERQRLDLAALLNGRRSTFRNPRRRRRVLRGAPAAFTRFSHERRRHFMSVSKGLHLAP